MSLTRGLLNDFHPLFSRRLPSIFEVTEEGNEIVIQEEMPGVKKEDLDVHLSNNGQSLTIEGRVHHVLQAQAATPAANKTLAKDAPATENTAQGKLHTPDCPASEPVANHSTADVVKPELTSTPAPTKSKFRSLFTRTLWLPDPVDGKRASAQLNDGILTLRIPKREHPGPERITIN
ncbi:hypothetical protein FRC11_014710 [Ceratobasidium sp. 423]|nr:hypothetical protein FRC11_014710 [Ceratobasidium sp. 423]